MDELLKMFEKALAEYQANLGKKDTLAATGEIMIQEFRKMRDNNVVLGQLLGDFYAQERQEGRKVQTLTPTERMNLMQQNMLRQLGNQRPMSP